MLSLELVGEVVDSLVVKVLATQMGISGQGLDLEDALLDSQDGDIEGAATEVEGVGRSLRSLNQLGLPGDLQSGY